MNEPAGSRWPRLLTAVGLLLVAVFFLLLVSGAFSGLGRSPLAGMPAPATPPVTRVPPPHATVEGLEESSGPTGGSQEGQEGRRPGR